ncbi:MAG: tetratricopeptide repeat protein [Planctomycetes bacterium]|nr:tetratricopeptide repeat protein [Planctomycetota bacterium]
MVKRIDASSSHDQSLADAEGFASSRWPSRFVLVALLVAATFLAFAPALNNGFVNWDDDYTLVNNDAFRGLSGEHLRWMFTTAYTGHFQPLSWVSFAIDWYVWELTPFGYHLTNLLLHAATGILLFFLVRRLLAIALPLLPDASRNLGALAAALLFSVHPLRVESVAWATERRDVLSAVWLMAALCFYLKMTAAPRGKRYGIMLGLAVLCYSLSLLSKASAITVPVVLLILDYFPLRRTSASSSKPQTRTLRFLLIEKLYFLVPAAIVAGLALRAQLESGALRTMADHPLGLRIGQAFYGIIFYLRASLFPVGLIPLYEQDPHGTAFDAANVWSAMLALVITVGVWRFRKQHPAWLFAWLVYLILLLPILGFAQSGQQIVADRYSYLSCMPWAVLAGAGFAKALASRHLQQVFARGVVLGGAFLAVAFLILASRAQTCIWHDSLTLWHAVIEQAPDTGSAHANLASAYNRGNEFELGRKHAYEALRILPGNRAAHIAVARSSSELGDFLTAEKHYETALYIRPADVIRLTDLAFVKTRLGKNDEAEALFRRALEVDPNNGFVYVSLAGFLAGEDRESEAAALLETAIKIQPDLALARLRLSILLLRDRKPQDAIATLEEGLRLLPDHPALTAKLAWVLATCSNDELRDGTRALRIARSVNQPGQPVLASIREALAAALAETGDFAAAVQLVEQTLADESILVPESKRVRLVEQLKHYRRGEPIRE